MIRSLMSLFRLDNSGVSETHSESSTELHETAHKISVKPVKNPSFIAATDKQKSEAAINAIYAQAGLAPPLIIWTQSPLANIFAKAAIDYLSEKNFRSPWGYIRRDKLEQNNEIRARAWQSVCEAGWKIGDTGTGAEAWRETNLYQDREDFKWAHIPPGGDYDRPREIKGIDNKNGWVVVGDALANQSKYDWLVHLWAHSRLTKKYPDPNMFPGGSRSMHLRLNQDKSKFRHQKNLNCLPAQVSDVEGSRFPHPTSFLSDFQTLRDLAGWVMPYENICFVSERATHLSFDEQNRLHCETGRAIAYADGFSICAWRGTPFPEAWLESKPTPSEALKWRNTEQRRVACEMLGWNTILKELNAVTIDTDEDPEIGELVSVDIPGIGKEKFLRVRCGTGRQFALPVPPKMKTALQANAWTWGLKPSQYKPEVRT